MNKLQDAKELLTSVKSRQSSLLKAQILYRQNQFEEALSIYNSLDLKSDPEATTNQCACLLQLNRAQEVCRTRLQESMFHYQNVATGLLRLQNYNQAKQLLEQAVELGESEKESADDIGEL
eukprot:UN34633